MPNFFTLEGFLVLNLNHSLSSLVMKQRSEIAMFVKLWLQEGFATSQVPANLEINGKILQFFYEDSVLLPLHNMFAKQSFL